MMTTEYRFTRSTLVLRDLARTKLRSPPPPPPLPVLTGFSEHTNVTPLEFIDESLSLLGHLYRTQDDHLEKSFEQQRDFIAGKFEQESYNAGQRDETVARSLTTMQNQLKNTETAINNFKEEVGQRFEEVGQRFEEVGQRFDKVEQRFEFMEERFQELYALTMNSKATSGWQNITPIGVSKPLGSKYQVPPNFPNKVRKFWQLKRPEKRHNLLNLLRFYDIRLRLDMLKDSDDSDNKSSSESPSSESALE